jgi:cytidylate kinase
MPAAVSEFKIIAIDGGAATGKSSTSRGVSERLQLLHVDTGAHYRTLTYALLKAGVAPVQSDDIPKALESLNLGTQIAGRSAQLTVNAQVPADSELRSPQVNANVSQFAAIEAVRQKLFDYQRSLAAVAREKNYAGLAMEGRDIGSVIFPDADFRFFLHADEATRSARRAQEGQTDSIAARDKMDSSRKTAPLVCPQGAIQINTGPHTLEAVIDQVVQIITT